MEPITGRATRHLACKATIQEASGRVIGPITIHGNGGPVPRHSRARIEKEIERATAGKPLASVYEPKPGHVRAYRHLAAVDMGEEIIDLRGAKLLAWLDPDA